MWRLRCAPVMIGVHCRATAAVIAKSTPDPQSKPDETSATVIHAFASIWVSDNTFVQLWGGFVQLWGGRELWHLPCAASGVL